MIRGPGLRDSFPALLARPLDAIAGQVLRGLALLGLLPLLTACDELRFPRDADGTLDAVLSAHRMIVAVSDNAPWVAIDAGGRPGGAEVALVQEFAAELGVTVEWRHLGAFAALQGLERGDINLAIGGFDRKAVMPVEGAAPSYAYFEDEILVGARPAALRPVRLEGQKVFIPPDQPLAELVGRKGGMPVAEWTDDVSLAAVPRWQLVSYDLSPTDIILHRAEHVFAVGQGENAWLMRLERFLRREAGDMPARLRASGK